MSYQGPRHYGAPDGHPGGVPWPGHQPDDFDSYQAPRAYQDYQAPGEYYRAPAGYRTSAVITEPPAYPGPETAYPGPETAYPGPETAYPGLDSDEFVAPPLGPAPVDPPAAGDGEQDPTAYVGLAPPAPGKGPAPGAWRRRGRGLLAGLTAGLLSAAAAITVAVLAAALLRPQASPVTAMAAMLRSGAVAHLSGPHSGARGHGVLLALTWVIIVGVAAALGLTASKRRAAGVIGMAAAFGAVAAFVVLTRPGSRAADVIPSLLGGVSGAAALALLAGAAAPQVVLARAVVRARTGYRRTGELDLVGTNRRRFLLASLSVTAAVAAAGTAGQLLTRKGVKAPKPEVAGPVQTLPPLPAADQLDNIAGISPFYTPNAKFYRVDTALVVPKVTPQEWKLRIHGMVDKPVEIDFKDLMSRPQLQRDITLICVSESVGGGYIGNARWQGARLADLLREAGVHPGATQIVMRDVQGMALGVSTEAVMDGRDALLATKMNGEPLPAEHGYPVRVVVPGLYGYVSACKWVVDMELTTYSAYDAYWVKRDWAAQALVKTESRIDTPKVGKPLQPGQVVVAGVAWATHRGIAKVEVGVDSVWAEATLASQDTVDTWRQWYYRWDATAGLHTLQVRATDLTGYTQTATVHGPPPNGATGYHTVKVTVG
jgi:DMSO/TMAO reductase YedYZ molybdopterin-dependent catalytic subunit